MSEDASFLTELDAAIVGGTHATRLRALWHATDLLIAGQYDEDQIWVFGEVIGRLADEIEEVARAELATRLAGMDRAPANAVTKLASDNSIAVARPLLERSGRLSTESLVQSARSKSQDHLLAIAKRQFIPVEVTDVLVVRGDARVVSTVAQNEGATLSKSGFLHLVKRSENDSILAENLGRRVDIPRHVFQQLIAKASADVAEKLQRERPQLARETVTAVTDAAGKLHLKFGPASKNYFVAKRLVSIVHQRRELNQAKIEEYAQARKKDEVVVGLSLMCGLPVNVIERALVDISGDLLLVLARSLRFSWSSTMALLFLAAPDHRISSVALEKKQHEFESLSEDTSRSIIEFYRSRKTSTMSDEPRYHS